MADGKSAALDQSRAALRSTLKLLRADLHTGLGAFTEQVYQMQRRYAATGFAGIARNPSRSKTPVQGLHGRATQTASIVDQVLATLATITDEATPQEATTTLTRAVAGIDRAHQDTMAIGRAWSSSSSPSRPGCRAATRRSCCNGPPRCSNCAPRPCSNWPRPRPTRGPRSVTRRENERGRRVGVRVAPTAPRRAPPPKVPAPPAAVDRLAGRLPTRRRPSDPVDGIFATVNGPAVQVASGRNTDTLADLKAGFRPLSADHAEGRAARMMRRYRIRHAHVVLNAQPCAYPRVGCRDALQDMLPDGHTLTVWVRDQDGPIRYFGTSTGNGKGLRT